MEGRGKRSTFLTSKIFFAVTVGVEGEEGLCVVDTGAYKALSDVACGRTSNAVRLSGAGISQLCSVAGGFDHTRSLADR